jgi:hypothetical protein
MRTVNKMANKRNSKNSASRHAVPARRAGALILLLLVATLTRDARDAHAIIGLGGPGIAVAAGPTFPTSGLTLWVNGRTGITTGSTFTWADQSTAGFGNLTQAVSADQPANGGSINSHNAVSFSGNPVFIQGSSALSNYVSSGTLHPFTVASVFQYTGAQLCTVPSVGNGDMAVTSLAANYVNWGFTICQQSVTTTELVVGFTQYDTSNKYVSITGPLYANPHWSVVTFTSLGVLGISVDGSAVTTTSSVGANVNYTLFVKMGGSTLSTIQYFTGKVGEYMIWNRVLSAAEITSLGTFFTSNWGTLGP